MLAFFIVTSIIFRRTSGCIFGCVVLIKRSIGTQVGTCLLDDDDDNHAFFLLESRNKRLSQV